MRLQLVDVVRQHGSHVILDGVTLQIDPATRLGLVGSNGSGKSTLLRILAGLEQPDSGTVVREPGTLRRVSPARAHVRDGERCRANRAAHRRRGRRTCARGAADQLAEGGDAAERYTVALDVSSRSEEATSRAGPRPSCRARAPGRRSIAPSIGSRAVRRPGSPSPRPCCRGSTCFCWTSRRTISTSTASNGSSDSSLHGGGARRRLARPGVPRPHGHPDRRDRAGPRPRPRVGGRLDGIRGRARCGREGAYARFSQAQDRRRELGMLLSERRTEARSGGAGDRRGTHALMTKVRQAERLLDRNELPEKPFEPWQLQLGLTAGTRPGGNRRTSHGRRLSRGGFTSAR